MGDRGLRQDAVSQVEDKRSIAEVLQNRIGLAVKRSTARQQRQRIEISLYRPATLDLVASKAAIDHPVQPYRIDIHAFHISPQQRAGAARESDDLRIGNTSAQPSDDPLCRRDAPARELVRSEHSGPGVEE